MFTPLQFATRPLLPRSLPPSLPPSPGAQLFLLKPSNLKRSDSVTEELEDLKKNAGGFVPPHKRAAAAKQQRTQNPDVDDELAKLKRDMGKK